MREQKVRRLTFVVVFVCMVMLFGAIYLCSRQIRNNLKIEMQNTLRDVAEQNIIAVQKEFDARFQLLYGIAAQLGETGDIENTVDAQRYIAENYRFKRIGYVYPDGSIYTTDAYVRDMSKLDFFRRGMNGDVSITEGIEDMTKQQYYSRLAVPVYEQNSGEIRGVLFATYQAEWVEELLNVKSFEGKGYSCIVKENGDIIAHSPGSPIGDVSNFFACLQETEEGNLSSVTEIDRAMQSDCSGNGSFALQGEQDFYYTPLRLGNTELSRYMITIVPAEVLESRMQPIRSNVEQIFCIILILVAGGGSIIVCTALSRRKQLMKLAYSDPITHGDNFSCFQERIKKNRGVHGYMVAMDLSDFKIINNTCGVNTGDRVLLHVWGVIHRSVHEGELAARIYADRFIMFLTEDDKQSVQMRLEQMHKDMEKISETLNTPRIVPIFGIHETFNQEPVENDYGKAVQAKHLVKGRRDHNYAFYDEIDYDQVLERRSIEDGFEQAITENQFEIWYQPKYDAENGSVVGAEALVRWRKADGTLLPPIKFIPVFEKNGMISRLDEYVFRTVCAQQKRWELQGKKILPVSVNISRISLYYSDVVDKYRGISCENKIDTKYLQLEITESATIDNAEISTLIEEFHTAGFEMLLDDFGSGYSSLSSLNMMHFDTMKLDKSLIDYIGDANGEKLLHYIIRLGQNLGLYVTAEGVETKEQVEFLRKVKCNDIQGYYFSKPLIATEFEKLLA